MQKLIVTMAILLGSLSLHAAEYTLQWAVSSDKNIVGYIVRYESSAGVSVFVDVGNTTKWKLQLTDGREYRVVVHSYDAFKNESKASNVVTINVPALIQPPTLAVPVLIVK